MRKTIVYNYLKHKDKLNNDLKSTHPKTTIHAGIKLAIAINDLKLFFFDYDDRWTAQYNFEKFNEARKQFDEDNKHLRGKKMTQSEIDTYEPIATIKE